MLEGFETLKRYNLQTLQHPHFAILTIPHSTIAGNS